MIPIKQTRVGEGGNCFQAAVASILELNLQCVPDFCNLYPEIWFVEFCKWLKKYDLSAIMIKADDCFEDTAFMKANNDVWMLVGGESPRDKNRMHEVVYLNGKMVHDPSPDNLGIIKPKDIIIFTVLNPKDVINGIFPRRRKL